MSLEGKYIYGIIREAEPRTFDFTGIGDTMVYSINHRKTAAVVSDTDLEDIDPTRQNVRAHTLVQEELLKSYTLLPTGFGMVAADGDKVLDLLEKNYSGLMSELNRLDGKVEIELKVFWDQEAMLKELQTGNDKLARLKAEIKNTSSPVETQLLQVEAGKLVERIALDWKAKYADRVYLILKGLSFDAKLNDPLGVRNILNASFLINKSEENDFRKEIYKLDAQYQDKVNFKYVGPLAPYNFVNLKLEIMS